MRELNSGDLEGIDPDWAMDNEGLDEDEEGRRRVNWGTDDIEGGGALRAPLHSKLGMRCLHVIYRTC